MAEIVAMIYGNSQKRYKTAAEQAENERQGRVTKGLSDVESAFSGFTPSFYDQRSQAYINYAMPQLADQALQARNAIQTNTANRGLLGTSQANKQMSALQRQLMTNQQTIAEAGRSQASQLRSDVEGRKGQLINQVYQSADPAGARQQATAVASSFQQPSVYQPISNMFSNLVNQYYQSSILKQANQPVTAGGGGVPSYYSINADSTSPYRSYTP